VIFNYFWLKFVKDPTLYGAMDKFTDSERIKTEPAYGTLNSFLEAANPGKDEILPSETNYGSMKLFSTEPNSKRASVGIPAPVELDNKKVCFFRKNLNRKLTFFFKLTTSNYSSLSQSVEIAKALKPQQEQNYGNMKSFDTEPAYAVLDSFLTTGPAHAPVMQENYGAMSSFVPLNPNKSSADPEYGTMPEKGFGANNQDYGRMPEKGFGAVFNNQEYGSMPERDHENVSANIEYGSMPHKDQEYGSMPEQAEDYSSLSQFQ
jgi:hypothetical protein